MEIMKFNLEKYKAESEAIIAKADFGNMCFVMCMENALDKIAASGNPAQKYSHINILGEYFYDEKGNILILSFYEDDGKKQLLRRYHKMVVSGTVNTIEYHHSNVIDSNITFTIEEVKEEYKKHVNNILEKLK